MAVLKCASCEKTEKTEKNFFRTANTNDGGAAITAIRAKNFQVAKAVSCAGDL